MQSHRKVRDVALCLKLPVAPGTANLFEPRHEKTCPTRSDSNWPAQPQKLARVLKFRL